MYEKYLRIICGVKRSTPVAILFAELGLKPLQFFWWEQSMKFWNKLAALPGDSLFHVVLQDNLADAFQHRAHNFASAVVGSLRIVDYDLEVPRAVGVVPIIDVGVALESLNSHLQGSANHALRCPRAAPSVGVLTCTYEQWFRPISTSRRFCDVSVSGRRMRRFLQFRLGSHGLPVAVGRLSGAGHLDRADRVCTSCDGHAVGDEMHMIFECAAVQPLRALYANLFTTDTDTMPRFFAQEDRLRVFQFVLDCLDLLHI